MHGSGYSTILSINATGAVGCSGNRGFYGHHSLVVRKLYNWLQRKFENVGK